MDFDWKPVEKGMLNGRECILKHSLKRGMVVRGGTCEGVMIVGDVIEGAWSVYDGGCGCCSDSYVPAEWAWIPGFEELRG